MPEFIIDDNTNLGIAILQEGGRGLILPEDRPRESFGYGDAAKPFSLEIIPEQEWEQRARDMEREESRLSDIAKLEGVEVKDQKQTPLCWSFATHSAAEVSLAVEGAYREPFAPAYAAMMLQNWRPAGYWGKPCIEFMDSRGMMPTRLWSGGDASVSKRRITPDMETEAAKNTTTEWVELKPGSSMLAQIVTCLFNRRPVSAGYNFMGHQVCLMDVVWKDGKIMIRFQNSWNKTWNNGGFGLLADSKRVANDAVSPFVVSPNTIKSAGNPVAV